MITKEEKLRLCKMVRGSVRYGDGSAYINPKGFLKYKGRALDPDFYCCRHTKKGGRMHKFDLKYLADGGDSYNRKRNGKERWWWHAERFFVCANCGRSKSASRPWR